VARARGVHERVAASSEEDVRRRFAGDNWARNGMLRIVSVERWTILLDGVLGDNPTV
jgi:hypothetical protein